MDNKSFSEQSFYKNSLITQKNKLTELNNIKQSLTNGSQECIIKRPINADNLGMIYNNSTLINNATSPSIDLNGFRSFRIWGNIGLNNQLTIEVNNTNNLGNASFWKTFDIIEPIVTTSPNTEGTFTKYYQDPPRVIRIKNTSGVNITNLNLVTAKYL